MPKYLEQRRRLWYAVLDVPKPLRQAIGKRRFVQSLETDSLHEAESVVQPIIHGWKLEISGARGLSPPPQLTKLQGGLSSPQLSKLQSNLAMVRGYAKGLKAEGLSIDEIKYQQWGVAVDVAQGPDNMGEGGDGGALLEAVKVAHGDKLLLVEHIEGFISSLGNTSKTNDIMRTNLHRFTKRFTFPEDATRSKVIDWVGKELGDKLNLSLPTKRRVISNCSGFWDYLERVEGLTLEPPFTKVLPTTSKKTKASVRGKRRAIRPTDYHHLLANCPKDDQVLYDLIVLGAHTGCRIEELCSLQLAQVRADRIEIADAKSEAGWRTIPLHRDVRKTVSRCVGGRDEGYLLTGLSLNKYGDRSNAIGKRFGRLKAALGYDKTYVFHSLRRGFATQLENATVSHNLSARLMGHELGDQTFGGYSDGVVFDGLLKAIEQISWQVSAEMKS